MKKAFITGITGQDGSYLAEFLLHKGYEVHGVIRRSSTFNTKRINHIYEEPTSEDGRNLFLHYGDMTDASRLSELLSEISPDEIYHMAAQSHVKASFDMPVYTGDVVGLGTSRLLEAFKNTCPEAKFYQASSSEMFGNAEPPQNEETPFKPQSPYACAKTYAYWMAENYKNGFGLFIVNGILFNHESPRRGKTFVTRKITKGVADIVGFRKEYLYLGNLDAKRDWGYTPEYVEAMWKMLQQESPENFVLGTGETHTVKEFVEEAFRYVGLNWKDHVRIDPRYFRPTEVDVLLADASRAESLLDWKPKIKFKDLVKIMVDADLEKAGITPNEGGAEILYKNFDNWHRWGNQVDAMED